MPLRFLLALFLTTVAQAQEPPAQSFIRVEEDAQAARLQTGITRYQKDGATVDLIGAIHIADKAYFDTLSKRFEGYEKLLYEMVGGEKFDAKRQPKPPAPEPAPPQAPEPAEADPEAAAPAEPKPLPDLSKIYGMFARSLALVGQAENIDYTKPNFVHADLTLKEFADLQKKRGESLLGFAIKSAASADPKAKQPNSLKLMAAMLSGNTNIAKLELIHTLGQGDDQVGALAGESVIITDRNLRALEVMDRELAAGAKNLGIFYGAAHFPDMEKRLLEKGFTRVSHEWLTAWDIPKPQPKPAEDKEAA